MGYTTDFRGSFKLMPAANAEQINYINTFCNTRRMKRDSAMLMRLFNGEHGLNGKYGIDGEFFIGGTGHAGQDEHISIIDYNTPAQTQPSLWCQWELSENGDLLEWDGGEKFYNYIEWLHYLINNFFGPWGIKLSGEVKWRGEDFDDMGKIVITDNNIEVTKYQP